MVSMTVPTLVSLWFAVIAFFWTGFLVLEGFDFGVGALARVLGRDDDERGALLSTIGPVWDGNEVWMVVAVGATFAAFPGWYATLLSALYLPVVVILLAFVARGVALEWRGKRADPSWRRRCDLTLMLASLAAPFGWGLVLAVMIYGLPLRAGAPVVGAGALGHPYVWVAGVVTVVLCLAHGAVFLRLRTAGALRDRCAGAARTLTVAAAGCGGVLAVWTQALRGTALSTWLLGAGVVALVASVVLVRHGRDGWAFVATTAAVGGTVAGMLVTLPPAAIPSTLGPGHSLLLADAAAGPYGLRVLTWASLLVVPAVLAYQGWAYWVFRRRVTAPARPDASRTPERVR